MRLGEVANQIIGSSNPDRKRSRPTSSLHYKVPVEKIGGKRLASPHGKLPSATPKRPPPKDFQQNHFQQNLYYRTGFSTRSRSSNGFPPRKYDLSDLEGLDEERLFQALYDDPELAAAAAAAKKQPKEYKKSTRPKSKSAELSEYPDHLRQMMDEGVPIKQWIIVLFLLGVGLYQLRKTLVGTPTTNKKAERGGRKIPKRGKVPKKARQEDNKLSTRDDGVDKVVAAIEGSDAKKSASVAKHVAKKQPDKKKAKKTKAISKQAQASSSKGEKTKSAPVQPSPESPETASTDDSSISADASSPQQHGAAQKREKVEENSDRGPPEATAPVLQQMPDETDDNDGDGWRTVAKPRATKTKSPNGQNNKAEDQSASSKAGSGRSGLKSSHKSADVEKPANAGKASPSEAPTYPVQAEAHGESQGASEPDVEVVENDGISGGKGEHEQSDLSNGVALEPQLLGANVSGPATETEDLEKEGTQDSPKIDKSGNNATAPKGAESEAGDETDTKSVSPKPENVDSLDLGPTETSEPTLSATSPEDVGPAQAAESNLQAEQVDGASSKEETKQPANGAANNGSTSGTKKKKKKKKVKGDPPTNDAKASATRTAQQSNSAKEIPSEQEKKDTASTDDDAALALRLQQEEENLVLVDRQKAEEKVHQEAWAEVTSKRKKKGAVAAIPATT